MDYYCPKPSCCRQRLGLDRKTKCYVCIVCGCDYIINDEGVPELKDPMVKL